MPPAPTASEAVNSPPPVVGRRPGRWFSVGLAMFLIGVSLAGFGPSIVDQSRRIATSTPLGIAHGVVAFAWLLLFLTQATLVTTGRLALHRRLGMAGAALALLMVTVSVGASITQGRRGYDASGDVVRVFSTPPGVAVPAPPTAESVVPLLGPLVGPAIWGALVAAALWYRRRPDVHKRLMTVALAYLVDVPLLHLVGVVVSWRPDLQIAALVLSRVVFVAVLAASGINDKLTLGRVHPVSLWVPLSLIAWEFALLPIVMSTTVWGEAARWLFL